MATVARTTQKVMHYAYYGDLYGTAELLCGSGYLFRKDGEYRATLISYKDPDLMLLGRCDLVADADEADGDRVRTCSRTLEPEDDGQLVLFAAA